MHDNIDAVSTIAEFCSDFPVQRRADAMRTLERAVLENRICHSGKDGYYWRIDMARFLREAKTGRVVRAVADHELVTEFTAMRVCAPSRRKPNLNRTHRHVRMTLADWREDFAKPPKLTPAAYRAGHITPTSLSTAEFVEKFDDLRERFGALGIIEMQGLTGLVLDEDIELAPGENPTLAQAVVIARVLRRERMIDVLPYQIRDAGPLEDEIAEARAMPSLGATSSATAIYTKLAMLGLETSLAAVRRAMGLPAVEAFNAA